MYRIHCQFCYLDVDKNATQITHTHTVTEVNLRHSAGNKADITACWVFPQDVTLDQT